STDVVNSITEEYKDYPVRTAGIKLAHDVGARKAYAYDIGQKCGTSVLALKQAHDLLVADDSVDTVLIAGGYRNSDLIDLTDPDVRFMYNLGRSEERRVGKECSPQSAPRRGGTDCAQS